MQLNLHVVLNHLNNANRTQLRLLPNITTHPDHNPAPKCNQKRPNEPLKRPMRSQRKVFHVSNFLQFPKTTLCPFQSELQGNSRCILLLPASQLTPSNTGEGRRTYSYAACPPCGNGPFFIVNLDILCTELTNLPRCLLIMGAAGAASLPQAKVRRARFPADKAM